MTFIWPHMLWFLLFVPILVLAYILVLRRRKKTAIRFASLRMVKEAMEPRHGFRRHLPPVLFLLGVTTIHFSTARPTAMITLPAERDTIVLAMDISGSMRATDVDPDRITASQEAAKAFINDQPQSTNIGVVAFAGTAMLVQQPTLDRETVLAAIDRFQLQRGTNIGGAILVSLQTLFPEASFDLRSRDFWSGSPPRGSRLGEAGNNDDPDFVPVEPGSLASAAIVLLTDGQATTGPDPVEAARMAADRGVRRG
jgi:Ca-activated chloride channel homolog